VRTLLLACALALIAASTAAAGTVSGRIVYCDTGDECRYFGDPRLDVTYRGTPGKRDVIRVLPHPTGVRVVSKGIEAGPFCFTVNKHDARCGPPAPEGLLMVTRTGDRSDFGFTHIGSLLLGSGNDTGIAYAASVFGGPGDDDLRGFGDGALIVGGPGDDQHLALFGDQIIQGGPGNDLIYDGDGNDRAEGGSGRDQVGGGHGEDELSGGSGNDLIAGGYGSDGIEAGAGDDEVWSFDPDRDTVDCGTGHDRAYVSRTDRVTGCETVSYGSPD
jgi:RTX calcium-binding nonapeptide repeat (4 copies)